MGRKRRSVVSRSQAQILFPDKDYSKPDFTPRGRKAHAEEAPEAPPPPPLSFTEQALALPRWGRTVLVIVFALALTLLVTPVIDNFYVTYLFSMDTLILPSLVSTALGVVVYFIGWRLIIGPGGETPTPSRAALIYLIFGLSCIALVLILLAIGVFTNQPTT